nr:hypothetical protein [Amycolatopsis palatopharyngis]
MEEVTVSGGTGVLDVVDGLPPAQRPQLAAKLRIALATGQIRKPLSDTLRPLLDLLTDGQYELSDDTFLPHGDWPRAEHARVEYYRSAIRAGHRPAAVLVDRAGQPGYVLDGLHKVTAYLAEDVTPRVIRIRRTDQV